MPRSCRYIRGKTLARSKATYRLINQLFDPLCVPSRTVGNVEGGNIIRAGLKHLIRAILLEVTPVGLLATVRPIELGTVANPPPSVEVQLAGIRIVEPFQDDESGKAFYTSDRTFKDLDEVSEMKWMHDENSYRRVDLLALQTGDVDLEVPEGIFGQPDFVRWGPPGDIHGVGLSHQRDDGPRIGPNPCSIKGTARGIDIESSEDLRGGGVQAKNNLDTAVWILG